MRAEMLNSAIVKKLYNAEIMIEMRRAGYKIVWPQHWVGYRRISWNRHLTYVTPWLRFASTKASNGQQGAFIRRNLTYLLAQLSRVVARTIAEELFVHGKVYGIYHPLLDLRRCADAGRSAAD